MTNLEQTVITTAEGKAKVIKGWLRTQIALNPLTWAVGALVLGFLVGAAVF